MDAPLVIGFDGSDSAAHAVRAAGGLLRSTSALIVTVWEPALASLPIAGEGLVGIDMPLDPQSAELLDEVSTERSRQVATQGVAIAREVGLDAQALTLPDELNVAETLAQVAKERGAAAIVVGSHGHGALHTRVLGSTSTKLLSHARCPVVVIPAPPADQP
jgi:nucleotide-binding universal stress UspA family protein